jgi:protein SCO1/2
MKRKNKMKMFATISCCVLLLTMTACQSNKVGGDELASCCDPEAAEAVKATTPLPGTSIYQLSDTWKTQDNEDVVFSSLRGDVRVLAMFFSHCEYACPIIVGDIKKIEMGLSDAERKKLKVTLVSFDVERDTPEVLKAYAKRMSLADRWSLLHGSNDSVRDLAAVLGIRFRKDKKEGFAHSNVIFLLNEDGEIIHRQDGLAADPAAMVAAVKKSL